MIPSDYNPFRSPLRGALANLLNELFPPNESKSVDNLAEKPDMNKERLTQLRGP